MGITGILMAGGKSSRMGTDKAMLNFQGRLLIEHALNLLNKVCDHILISANNIDKYSFLNVPVISDEKPGLGPVGGIYSCLRKSGTEKNLVLACDMPFVPVLFLERLIKFNPDALFVAPSLNGIDIEPLCAVFDKAVQEPLYRMICDGDLKLQNLKFYCKTDIMQVTNENCLYQQGLFSNLNTPDDLSKSENAL